MATHFAFKDPKTVASIAEGLLKAGLPGESSGYYKIFEENVLTGKEIEELVFGRKVSGSSLKSGDQWVIERTQEGKANLKRKEGSYVGKSWVENDMLCDQWNDLYGDLKECCRVYRNPEGTPEKKNEYLWVAGYDIYPFSPVN
jgi:adenylate cyclase